jgi:hypothetical protein
VRAWGLAYDDRAREWGDLVQRGAAKLSGQLGYRG